MKQRFIRKSVRNGLVLSTALSFCVFNVIAQDKENLILGAEIGFFDLSEKESFGLFLNVDAKLKSSKNTFVGLRTGLTLNSETIENRDSTLFNINGGGDNGVVSVVPTLDYYWNDHERLPYLGIGVGTYILSQNIEISRGATADFDQGEFKINVKYKIGFLLRGGINTGKLRLGLEYNFVPKSNIQFPDGQEFGKLDLSYLGLSVGFKIGGWDI